jgi:hypothetical protein
VRVGAHPGGALCSSMPRLGNDMVGLGRGGLWTKWPRVRGHRTGPQEGPNMSEKKRPKNNKTIKTINRFGALVVGSLVFGFCFCLSLPPLCIFLLDCPIPPHPFVWRSGDQHARNRGLSMPLNAPSSSSFLFCCRARLIDPSSRSNSIVRGGRREEALQLLCLRVGTAQPTCWLSSLHIF